MGHFDVDIGVDSRVYFMAPPLLGVSQHHRAHGVPYAG